MNAYVDFILGFLLSPRDEIEKVKNNNLAVPAFINLLIIVIAISIGGQILYPYGGVKSIVLLVLNTTLNAALILSFIFIASGWYHFISALFGKHGEIKNTITLMALSLSPLLLSLPSLIILLKLTGNPVMFYSVIMFLIFIWIFSLSFISIRLNYGLSARETAVVLFSPVIFIPLFFVIITISLVIFAYAIFT